jgi:hypothetical protein
VTGEVIDLACYFDHGLCGPDQLASYAAKIVTISGTIVHKKGVNVIENAQLLSEEAQQQRSPDFTDLRPELGVAF